MVSLARHHAKRSESGSGLGREVLYWYGRAIANGWSGAVAELGYLLLGEAAHVREAVVLLAIAELLGDRRASDDLALVPQLVDVTPAEIGAARREARARLTARRLWNGELFHDVPIRLTGDEQARAFRRLKSIDEALARGRPPLSRASARARTPPRLDAERRASHLHYAQDKNAPRIRHEERLEAERASDARALGERRARLDRIERRRRARDLKVAAISERERGELQRELERRVARINRHRDPSAALDAGELMARALRPSAAPARGQRR